MTRAPIAKSAWRKWIPRAAGSAIILGLLFWFLPFDSIAKGFASVPIPLFLGVTVAFVLGHVVAAAKWWNLMDRGLPFGTALRAHFAGLASNLALPGASGGDAVRATIAQMSMKDGGKVVSAAVADRLIDMLGLACLAVAGLVMIDHNGGSLLLAIEVLALMVVLVVGAVFVAPRIVPAIWARFPKLPAKGLALRTSESLGTLGRRPGLMLVSFVLSIAVQAMFVLLTVELAQAIGVKAELGAWFFAWPLAKILAVLPISLNGLGVREATLAGLLTPFGAVAADVVATGLVWQAMLFIVGGLGAAILAMSGLRINSATPTAQKSYE